jgi:hypothetical protein
MKPAESKKQKAREIIHALMDCSTEEQVFDLIKKTEGEYEGDQDMIIRFSNRLTHIEDLQEEKLKSYKVYMN